MSGARSGRQGWRYRANVAARVVAGSVGAYGVAALFAAALARTLPMSRVEAVSLATLLAFLVAPAAAVWAFLAPGPWRAWAGMLGAALLFGAIAWFAGPPA
ncbi:DUF3649 domain-containing protein [Sphingomonas sp. JC676]|uniref:DUF3649 domain-containing protein n=1 Tax=Sphingomonas sp. JC676 TaxID=2768065 RepID=UPI00292A55B7|nr:DUF3649 domain-containing protein [Sphingomonas sp. JC676]